MSKPRKRRRTTILLSLFVLGIIGVGVTIMIARWRTEVAWRKFKARWEAQGEVFEIAPYLPPAIPNAENLAHHPLFEGIWIEGSDAELWFEQIDPALARGYMKSSSLPFKDLGYSAHFSEWKDLDPSLTDPQRIEEILRRFEPLNDPLDQVAAALQERPVAHFPVNLEDGITMSTPHLFTFLRVASALSTRAGLRTHSRAGADAARDTLSLQRLATAAGNDGYLIAFVIEVSIRDAGVQVLWDGLREQVFTEPELAQLAAEFAGIEPIGKRLLDTLRIERSFILQTIDKLEHSHSGRISGSTSRGGNRNFLIGMWMDSNRLFACEAIQNHLLAPEGTIATRAVPSGATAFARSLAKRSKGLSKQINSIALLAVPSIEKVVMTALDLEADLTNARIAIALERHRLAHYSYPRDLAALVPEFLPALPTDLINNRPVEYRIKSNGTPLIYQLGCDGDDDHAAPRKAAGSGDVVWQYSRNPPLTEAEWRLED